MAGMNAEELSKEIVNVHRRLCEEAWATGQQPKSFYLFGVRYDWVEEEELYRAEKPPE